MASSQISTFVIVLVLAVGARAAPKDLGEVCSTSGDTCVHPSLKLVCDVMALKCLIQVGQTCNGDGNSVYCVTGAKCDTNVCTCDTSGSIYSTDAATGTCTAVADSYGAACGSGTTCTATGDHLLCAASSSKCTCTDATFVYATATGNCVPLANEKIGKTCAPLSQTTDCGVAATTHMTCVSLACACEKGYTGVVGGSCSVIAATKIGHVCTVPTTAADCGGANLACHVTDFVCQCATGYTGVPGGVCFPAKSTLKGGCALDNECGGAGKVCTQLSGAVKTCKTTSVAGDSCTDTAATICGNALTCDGTCKVQVGGSCGTPTPVCVTGLTCDGTCKTVVQAGDSCTSLTTKCAVGLICETTCKTAVGFGGDCSSATTTKCNTGMTCTGNKCVSSANYNGGTCTVTSTAFDQGSCTSGANTVCGASSGGVCLCKTGYSGDPPSACAIKAKMYGGTCSTATANTKGDCNDVSLVCSATPTGTCACATGYSGGVDGKNCYADKSLNGKCSASLVCSDPNAECPASVCTCKTDYVEWNGKCLLKISSTGTCSGKTCVDGSTCSTTTNKCTCNTGYTEVGGLCLPAAANVYRGLCTVTAAKLAPVGTCTDTNGICDGGRCLCKDTYTGNFGDICRLSGAGTITLSISLLMLQLAACVWQAFPA